MWDFELFRVLIFEDRCSPETKPHPQIGCNKTTPLFFHRIYPFKGLGVDLYEASVKHELTMSELRSCVVEAMIRGYHEYQSIWEVEVGENLTCIREPGNVRDPYAVAVTKPEASTIVGPTSQEKCQL